jgi:hypothetical protein
MSQQPRDTATEATAEQGTVMLDGLGRLALSIIPADASAKALARAAAEAEVQSSGDAPDRGGRRLSQA